MPRKYQSFAEQFYLGDASLWQRLGRDVRLLKWMLQTMRMWWKARPVRAEFERCRAAGLPFYVDRFAGPLADPGVSGTVVPAQPIRTDVSTDPESAEP